MTRDGDDEELGSLAPLVRQLPREVAPPRLWKGIAARLEPRGRLDIWPLRCRRRSIRPRISGPRSRRASCRVDGCDALPSRSPHPSPSRQQSRSACSSASTTTRALSAPVASVAADDTASDGAGAAIDFGWVLGAPAVAGDIAANLSGELALVRDERLSIERAIAKEPDNIDLRELWAFTYETELQLADACGRTVMEYQRDRG